MFRVLGRLAVIAVLLGPAAPGCGSPQTKTVKTVKKKDKQKQRDTRALLGEARDAAKSGDVDAADKAYTEAFDIAKELDIIEEHVDFLIHAGRASHAVAVAKEYNDANATDVKGYQIYAEALLAANKGDEALKVAGEIIDLASDDAGGYEKRGRALLMLDKPDDALEALRK